MDEAQKAREVAEELSAGLRWLSLEFNSRRMSNDFRPSKAELAEAERLGLIEWYERVEPYEGRVERRRRGTSFNALVAARLQETRHD